MSPELLSVAATIQGAQIQANATYWAALWGALGLIASIGITWLYTNYLQRKARVAECRREVYLALAEAYSKLMAGFQHTPFIPQNYDEYIRGRLDNFSVLLDKTMFICETSTKKEILDFYRIFIPLANEMLGSIQDTVESYNNILVLKKQHEIELDKLKPIHDRLDEINIENPIDEKIKNALELLKTKFGSIEELTSQIKEQEKKYALVRDEVSEKNKISLEIINDKAINLMYLLRQDIGIKTNRKLDKYINEKLKEL